MSLNFILTCVVTNSSASKGIGALKRSALENVSSGFMEEIESRLIARAGNPPSFQVKTEINKSEIKDSNPKFGKGISELEIDKIIKEFNK